MAVSSIPKMAEDLASRRTLEDGLRHALENDHFQLLYQPQIELSTGRTIGYEAMLRWRAARARAWFQRRYSCRSPRKRAWSCRSANGLSARPRATTR